MEILSFDDVFECKWTPEMLRIMFKLVVDEFW